MKTLFLKKKVIAALMAGMFAFGTFTAADAVSREELAAINVQTAADFQYWEKNAPSKAALVRYVCRMSPIPGAGTISHLRTALPPLTWTALSTARRLLTISRK